MAHVDVTDEWRIGREFRTGRLSRASLLFLLSILFILAPKVNLVSFGDSGLRVEDFVLFAALPVLLWKYRLRAIPTPFYVRAFWVFIAVSVVSAVLNYGEIGVTGLIYVGRQVQYFLWFLIGVQFSSRISEKTFRRGFGLIAAVLLLWWLGEATHIIPKIGRFTVVGNRVTLNTSGPYEIAILVVFVFLLAPKTWQKIGMVGILLATQSRITLAAFAVVWFLARPTRNVLLSTIVLPLAFLTVAFFPSNFAANSRVAQTATLSEMVSSLQTRLNDAPQITSLNDYRGLVDNGLNSNVGQTVRDRSFEIRAFKWALIVKSLGSSTAHLLFGWGPGAWGLAVDGHYFRFLGEGGLVGFFAAMVFFGSSLFGRQAPREYRLAFMAMALSCLFIDAATSSKVSSTLWLIGGYFSGRKHHLSRQGR